ncbi:MAG: trimethylamine methyltransferase family protein [Desulfobacterales bacterium]|jgi:trimethylamine--corrinoid protein Co-methyltransferase
MSDLSRNSEKLADFRLNTLSKNDCSNIHLATLRVLEKTGICVENTRALEVFHSHGAAVDHKNRVVRLPASIVEDAIQSAPSQVTLAGLKPDRDIILEDNSTVFTNFSGNIRLVDPRTFKVRQSNKKDLEAATRLCDAIDEIGIYSRALYPIDRPSEVLHLHTAEACFSNTTKHCFHGPGNEWELIKILEMVRVAVGGSETICRRKPITFVAAVSSPLHLTRNFCDVVVGSAQNGFSTGIASMVMAGGTGPIHLAGTLVQTNAEVLAGIVLAQLVNKGAPVIYSSFSTAMDLRLGSSPMGSPESAIIASSVSRLCQYYQVPCWVPGIATDSKQKGIQAAFEKTLTGFSTTMAGANLIGGIGGIETGLTFDFALAVLDAEIVKLIMCFKNGVEINEETLSEDIIHEIGPLGNFLSHGSTIDKMRSLSQTYLFDRSSREYWQDNGKPQSYIKARNQAINIIETHRPNSLSKSAAEEIRSIVIEAEKEVGLV